jgi:hypothetical protein
MMIYLPNYVEKYDIESGIYYNDFEFQQYYLSLSLIYVIVAMYVVFAIVLILLPQ